VVVLVSSHPKETNPVCFEVEGESGIPIFETVEDAKEFAEAYKEVLGPGLEALDLPDQTLAQLLEKCADKTEYVILTPKPKWTIGNSVWWEMIDIGSFVEGLRESGL